MVEIYWKDPVVEEVVKINDGVTCYLTVICVLILICLFWIWALDEQINKIKEKLDEIKIPNPPRLGRRGGW